jgi:hypothetical protein
LKSEVSGPLARTLLGYALWIFFGLGCLALGCWLRALEAPEWLQPDTTQNPPVLRPWMVEADCYSQMARVQRILRGEGLIQNHFKVENWPEGLVPSTTAPFDYLILLLQAPLRLVTRYPLDWAGALISPLLWAGLVLGWMFFRSREFTRLGRTLLIFGSTLLPGFLWATAFGRPRHQSLVLVLLALGLTAEYERWHMVATPRRIWSIFAGIVWGFACWTSLFEPMVVFTVLLGFNWIVRRRESVPMLITYGTVMLVALILEGPHLYIPPPEYRGFIVNWLGTIAEVRGLGFSSLIQQMTLGLLLLPFVAWPLWSRENFYRTDRLMILLTFLFTFFTALQSRWIYYASLGELFLIVRYIQMAPAHWSRLTVLGIFLLGLADGAYTKTQASLASEPAQPSLQLLQISRSIDQPGGIMAPWWLSPGLLYFSGQPIVAGSSHCGISGIVSSAQFFTATSWTEAESILRARQVRWIVVADDPRYVDPLLNTSRGILGLPYLTEDDPKEKSDNTVAETLINDQFVPTWLHLRGVTSELKLYEYVPVAE